MKWIYLIICCLPIICNAQKVLQLEKIGSAKTTKFVAGNAIVYQMEGDDIWYEATIEEIRADAGFIMLNDRLVDVTKIVALKSFKNRKLSYSASRKLYTFAGSWVFFGIADRLIFNKSPDRAGIPLIVIPAVSALAIGYTIRKIFDHRIYKMGKKYRLRLLDLDPIPAKPRA